MGLAVLKCPSCGAPACEGRRVCEFCGALLLSDELGLGLLDADAARLDKLVASARAALAKDPDDPAAHCHLGVGLFKRGQYEDAIGEFKSALRARPEAWGVLYLEAFAFALARNFAHPQVEELCKKALELNAQCREAKSLLHLCAGQQAQDSADPDYAAALAEFRAALALGVPEHMPYIYDFSGQAFDGADDKEDAIKMYRQACERGFVNASILTRLGVLLKETGQPQLALCELEKAVELDPVNPAIRQLLAELRSGRA